jgi:hypothetical protein
MSTYTQPCEYQDCQCTVTGALRGGAYCSEICAARDTSDEETMTACECGHSPCDTPG